MAAVALFSAYFLQSRTVTVGSDGGSIALQARDMLHGNALLSGWTMSDVSFWPTELVQYVLIEAAHGLGPGVVHIGGAMTYTLLLLLAACLAKGRATGRDSLIRVLVAAGLAVPPRNANLAAWLVSRHLRAGLTAEYWVANSTSLDAGTRVTIRQVSVFGGHLVRPIAWGFKGGWYDPARQHANFIVTSDADSASWARVRRIAGRTLGPPDRTYRAGEYTVLVWPRNLLAGIR